MSYLIEEVRRLTGASTAEYTVGTVSYYTDDHIERILDSRRVRMARIPVEYEYELDSVAGDGSQAYLHATVPFAWLEDTSGGTSGFVLSNGQGSLLAGSIFTLSPEDGYIEFSSDRGGTTFYASGWVHDPYQAAVDVLTSWASELSRQVDWVSDNMRVNRSQKAKSLREQINVLNKMAGLMPIIRTHQLERTDIEVEAREYPSSTWSGGE
jgi:hypothetical protein